MPTPRLMIDKLLNLINFLGVDVGRGVSVWARHRTDDVSMWIGPLIVALVSMMFFYIARFASKLALTEIDVERLTKTETEITSREPPCSILMCVMLSSSLELGLLAVVGGVWLHFFSVEEKEPKATFLVMISLLYNFFGFLACYTGVQLKMLMKSDIVRFKEWIVLSFGTSLLSSAILYGVLIVTKSEDFVFLMPTNRLVVLWLIASMPLRILGGFFGAREEQVPLDLLVSEYAVSSSSRWRSNLINSILLPGSVALFLEIVYMLLDNHADGSSYYITYLFTILLFPLVSVCKAWKVLMDRVLTGEESYLWWWRLFIAFGVSAGLHVYLRFVSWPEFRAPVLDWLVSMAENSIEPLIVGVILTVGYGSLALFASILFLESKLCAEDHELRGLLKQR